jgi:hypothetical protein
VAKWIVDNNGKVTEDAGSEMANWVHAHLLCPTDNMPLKLRWYQEEIMSSQAKRVAIRAGRRIGKTSILAAYALYSSFLKASQNVLFLTPNGVQADDAVRHIQCMFPRYRQCVDNRFTMYNNSTITVMQANEASVKGRGVPDVLVVDEAADLSPSATASVEAVILRNPGIPVWMAGTPNSRRDMFHTFCSIYKEFRYPSSVSPTWTPQLEIDFKTSLSHTAYRHEIEAEF